MYDDVRVERARVLSILVETIKSITKWSSVSRPTNDRYSESSDDVRITTSGQTTIRSNTTTWLVQHPRASTTFTLQEQGRRSRRELRGVDDDSGKSDELRQSIGLRRGTSETAAESCRLRIRETVTHGQFPELQHVLPTPDRDLHIRNLHFSQIPGYSIRAEITI